MSMTHNQEMVFNHLKSFPGMPLTIQQVANTTNMSYQSTRLALMELDSQGQIKHRKDKANSNTGLYWFEAVANGMPIVRHWEQGETSIKYDQLVTTLCSKDPNDFLHTKYVKSLGLYLSQLAAFWADSDNYPTGEAVEDLRMGMREAANRSLWQFQMLMKLVEDNGLWNSKTAPQRFFGDDFTPERAIELFEKAQSYLFNEDIT